MNRVSAANLCLTAVEGLPLVAPGDDLAALIDTALNDQGIVLEEGDCLILAQKIVSKAEDRYCYLNRLEVSDAARDLAQKIDKEPALCQAILDESVRVVRHRPGAVIVEHRLGYVHANAGIDRSNIESDDHNPRVLLLPLDPDGSAARLREQLSQRSGVAPMIIINDSAGRPFRNGTHGFAIGTAGFEPLENRIGDQDLFGRELEVTEVAVADELAAAASLLMGQAGESVPLVHARGLKLRSSDAGSKALIRDAAKDLFR